MATNDPKSRLTESSLNSPYASPNGVAEQGTAGRTASGATTTGEGMGEGSVSRPEETPGEKIGRFFRRAMERIAGRDDESWRRENERTLRDRDAQERYRTGERPWQAGRSAVRERGQSEWNDPGRSRDDRNQSYRAAPSGDAAGNYERLQSSRQGSGSLGYGQGTTGRSYGQGQASVGQPSFGQGQGDESLYGERQPMGQRLPESSERQVGPERGFEGGHGRDWRGQERWGDRSVQSGPSGMSGSYAASGASFGFERDETRLDDWTETARDRDEGQGRRFWQREPLSARDVMTRNPRTVTRQSPIREAALVMRDENCGVVPIVDGAGRLEGILTDRDIVVRGLVAEGLLRRIEEVMTDDVSAVTEDEPLTSVLDLMGRKQIRRVPVVDRNDRLLGIISMADIANRADYDEDLQDAFERISSRRSFWSLFS